MKGLKERQGSHISSKPWPRTPELWVGGEAEEGREGREDRRVELRGGRSAGGGKGGGGAGRARGEGG